MNKRTIILVSLLIAVGLAAVYYAFAPRTPAFVSPFANAPVVNLSGTITATSAKGLTLSVDRGVRGFLSVEVSMSAGTAVERAVPRQPTPNSPLPYTPVPLKPADLTKGMYVIIDITPTTVIGAKSANALRVLVLPQ